MTVGVSCCERPANLGTVWVAHSRPVLSALNTLHGLHGLLVDQTGAAVTGRDLEVTINKTVWDTDISSGHFWRLLTVGKQDISVGDITKVVSVVPGQMNVVKFQVEPGFSSFLVLCLLASTSLLFVALFILCRLEI